MGRPKYFDGVFAETRCLKKPTLRKIPYARHVKANSNLSQVHQAHEIYHPLFKINVGDPSRAPQTRGDSHPQTDIFLTSRVPDTLTALH